MKNIAILLLTLLTSACAGEGAPSAYTGPVNPLQNQDEAVAIIWHTYGAEAFNVPPIVWKYNDVCDGVAGAFKTQSGVCAAGQFNEGDNYIQIEYTTSVLSNSGLVHELCHALRWYQFNDDDATHQSICFEGSQYYFGNPGSLVEAARTALVANGL